MPAHICDSCGIAWPSGAEFEECADCGGPTVRSSATQRDFTYAEARNRMRFRQFYERRERERVHRGDPSPEALGALQARQELAKLRELEALAAT